ncbi:hypothetical protein GJ496_005942 [Pomphorhynchus laevis]|nr:hypothetical protein GJ496_005942 [Pomphorhynchus laevis]
MIFKKLLPEIIGIPNIEMELRSIICLQLRLGGMGVSDPSTEPKTEFDRSQRMLIGIQRRLVLTIPDEVVVSPLTNCIEIALLCFIVNKIRNLLPKLSVVSKRKKAERLDFIYNNGNALTQILV